MARSATSTDGTTVREVSSRDTAVVVDLPTGAAGTDQPSLLVHVQLRPRRAAARKCLAALAQLATEHAGVPVTLAGLSKDDRVLRVTVAVDLGPRTDVARFSASAQAAYGFVSDLFTVLYEHMPVYATEPTAEESAVVAPFLQSGTADRGWAGTPVWPAEVLDAVSA